MGRDSSFAEITMWRILAIARAAATTMATFDRAVEPVARSNPPLPSSRLTIVSGTVGTDRQCRWSENRPIDDDSTQAARVRG
jgi:hypothetical protein